MTFYGAPPGRYGCCACGADLGPITEPPPKHRVIDACGWPLDWCEACWRRGGEGMNRGDFVMGPDGASERARRRHALDAQRRDVRADIKRWLD